MAEEKTRLQSFGDRLSKRFKTTEKTFDAKPKAKPKTGVRNRARARPQGAARPVSPGLSSRAAPTPRGPITPASTSLVPQSRALVPQSRALTTTNALPNLSNLQEPAKKAVSFSKAARFLGRGSGVAGAVIPVDAGNAENTLAARGIKGRRADFERVQAQGGFFQKADPNITSFEEFDAAPNNPASFEEVESQAPENVRNLLAQESEAAGLRNRNRDVLPAPGQGFIQNERTKAVTEFGQDDPEGTRLASEQRGSSEGLRGRGVPAQRSRTGNAFADLAFGFGDAARAGIAEGRGQAERARSQRLNESAIAALPAAQKEARLAEKARADAAQQDLENIRTENADSDAFRTKIDEAPNEESRRLVQKDAISDLVTNGPGSPGGRHAISSALSAIGKKSGNRGALSSERGIFDFINSFVSEGFPNEEFGTAIGLSISNDGDIMQDMGGGNFTVVLGLDDLDDFSRDTLTAVLPALPAGG